MTPLLQHFDRLVIVNTMQCTASQRRRTLAEFDRLRLPIDCDRIVLAEHSLPEQAAGWPGTAERADHLAHLHELTRARADGARHVLVTDGGVRWGAGDPTGLLSLLAGGDPWQLLALVHDGPAAAGALQWVPSAGVSGVRAYAVHADFVPAWLEALHADAPAAAAGRAGPLGCDGAVRAVAARADVAFWRTSRSLDVDHIDAPPAGRSPGRGSSTDGGSAGRRRAARSRLPA